jgi:hypothetical protein
MNVYVVTCCEGLVVGLGEGWKVGSSINFSPSPTAIAMNPREERKNIFPARLSGKVKVGLFASPKKCVGFRGEFSLPASSLNSREDFNDWLEASSRGRRMKNGILGPEKETFFTPLHQLSYEVSERGLPTKGCLQESLTKGGRGPESLIKSTS